MNKLTSITSVWLAMIYSKYPNVLVSFLQMQFNEIVISLAMPAMF
jgi:hypothetical protein